MIHLPALCNDIARPLPPLLESPLLIFSSKCPHNKPCAMGALLQKRFWVRLRVSQGSLAMPPAPSSQDLTGSTRGYGPQLLSTKLVNLGKRERGASTGSREVSGKCLRRGVGWTSSGAWMGNKIGEGWTGHYSRHLGTNLIGLGATAIRYDDCRAPPTVCCSPVRGTL